MNFELHGIALNWIELNWIEFLNWIELHVWIELKIELNWIFELNCIELHWIELWDEFEVNICLPRAVLRLSYFLPDFPHTAKRQPLSFPPGHFFCLGLGIFFCLGVTLTGRSQSHLQDQPLPTHGALQSAQPIQTVWSQRWHWINGRDPLNSWHL